MTDFDIATVLAQWASGGLFFLWVTTRTAGVSSGYTLLLRAVYLSICLIGLATGLAFSPLPLRDVPLVLMIVLVVGAMISSRRGKPDPSLDLTAALIGLGSVLAVGLTEGVPAWLAASRLVLGAVFMGVVGDAMLLGHWYLVQPKLGREPIKELVKWCKILWVPQVLVWLIPTGLISVWSGNIDDGYGGMLGWFWAASVVTTFGLFLMTSASLKEKSYSAVMAATGLLYLTILTGFAIDLVGQALIGKS